MQSSYLAHDARSLLLECVTVEGYLRQAFFVVLTDRPERVMIRLLPRTSPEKTPGVRRCVAWIALWFRSTFPGSQLGSTNLEAELGRADPGDAPPPELETGFSANSPVSS